jgi:hypothetical protein
MLADVRRIYFGKNVSYGMLNESLNIRGTLPLKERSCDPKSAPLSGENVPAKYLPCHGNVSMEWCCVSSGTQGGSGGDGQVSPC